MIDLQVGNRARYLAVVTVFAHGPVRISCVVDCLCEHEDRERLSYQRTSYPWTADNLRIAIVVETTALSSPEEVIPFPCY